MVWIYAHGVAFEVERKLAELDVLQLILMQIGPTPNPGVDDVRETFSPSYLQTPIQSALNGDAFAVVRPVGSDGRDQRVQFVTLLL